MPIRQKIDFDFEREVRSCAKCHGAKERKYSDRPPIGTMAQVRRVENVQVPPHGMSWNKFSHSNVSRRVGGGREMVVQSNGPLLTIPWPLPPRVDRCRRVVAIRDDILLRLEQRMSMPRCSNVRKFHYVLQYTQKPPPSEVQDNAPNCNRERMRSSAWRVFILK